MDLGETLFGIAWRWLRRRTAGTERGLEVDVHDRRLLALAALLAGRPVLMRVAEAAGGQRGNVLLLPARLDLGDAELEIETLLLRICVGATAMRPGACPLLPLPEPGDFAGAALHHVLRMAAARDVFLAEFPAAASRLRVAGQRIEAFATAADVARGTSIEGTSPLLAWQHALHTLGALPALPEAAAALAAYGRVRPSDLPPPSPLYGAPLPAADISAAEAAMAADSLRATLPAGTERTARPRDALERVRLQQDETPPLPVHVFEKVDTLDDFRGGRRKVDGSDELAAHQEALDEVDLRAIVRGGADVASIYRLDAHGLEAGSEAGDDGANDPGALLLDEWDIGRAAYRRGWVRAFVRDAEAREPEWLLAARGRLGGSVRGLERVIAQDRSRRRFVRRQPDGTDIDLDALVEERAAAAAGHGHFDRVDLAERRELRDVATLVLLDLSLSADAWVGGGERGEGRRVLDLTRDAAYVVAEVGWRLGDRVALLGFGSNTRHRVELTRILDWDARWPDAAARLGALRPRGYTRIGPALRFGRMQLERSGARHRVMLLVTDGKPTDDDRYEGRYGVADVRQAVREAEAEGIDVHALCLDRAAAATMPAMVGAGRFELLRDPLELPTRLAGAWRRHARR